MGKIKLLIKYFVYRIRRKGSKGHGIHSPYVFEFNRDLLNSKVKYRDYNAIDSYRKSIRENRQLIRVSGHGAGSGVFSSAIRRVKDIARYSSSDAQTCRLLFRLARSFSAPVIIELGTSLGMGTYCLARGGEDGVVYSLEACPEQLAIARDELVGREVQNVELIQGTFSEMLPGLLERLEKVDLVYMDGDHREDSVLWQFGLCAGKAGNRTVFIVGDIHWSTGMERAWKKICSDNRVSITVDLFYAGLVCFRKGIAKQHFVLSYG